MLSVTATISGDKEFLAKVKKLGQEFYMLQAAMEDIGESLDKYYAGPAFASQGGVYNEVWESLNDRYALRKATGNTKRNIGKGAYPGRPPLVKTGNMRDSFVYDADQTSVTITNTADYFKYHQSSAARTSNLPRREMIGKNKDVQDIVNVIINKAIHDKIMAAGL